jgi:hypothetical protein
MEETLYRTIDHNIGILNIDNRYFIREIKVSETQGGFE